MTPQPLRLGFFVAPVSWLTSAPLPVTLIVNHFFNTIADAINRIAGVSLTALIVQFPTKSRHVSSNTDWQNHVDEIEREPLPSGHTSRRWGVGLKMPDGSVVIERDPWQA
jgi:hypothetical protein